MPPASRLAEAVANDEEHVEAILAARERSNDAPSTGPRIFGYTGVEERLDRLIDVVQVNTAATIAAAGGKAPSVDPQPRPETAFERVAHRRKTAKYKALSARLLGSRKTE